MQKDSSINEDLQKLYKSLESEFKTEVNMWGNIMEYYHITTPATDGVFSSKEPSQEKMDSVDSEWKKSMDDYNVMLVTIGRSSTENGTYLPGVDGVDASQNLNQTDPLGLSDDERDLINAAVEAKENNGGKVIVMLNNANAMEIDEIKNNDGVDAIMEVGLTGRLRLLWCCRYSFRRSKPVRSSDRYLCRNKCQFTGSTELWKL